MEPWQRARDARPVVGAGPGFGRDRPQPGDERRAGIGSQGRAPRRDVRHRQAGEGRGRRPASWDAGSRRGRPDRPHVAGIACVRMANGSFGCTASAADVSARGSPAVRPPPWTPGAGAAGAGTGGIMGPPRMAAWTVSRAVPAMARGASASCTPPGSGNAACLPRPAWPATRTAAPWPRAPTARTGPGSSGDASPSGIRGTWNRRRSGGSRGGDSKRPHRPSGHRTPERTEPSIM